MKQQLQFPVNFQFFYWPPPYIAQEIAIIVKYGSAGVIVRNPHLHSKSKIL